MIETVLIPSFKSIMLFLILNSSRQNSSTRTMSFILQLSKSRRSSTISSLSRLNNMDSSSRSSSNSIYSSTSIRYSKFATSTTTATAATITTPTPKMSLSSRLNMLHKNMEEEEAADEVNGDTTKPSWESAVDSGNNNSNEDSNIMHNDHDLPSFHFSDADGPPNAEEEEEKTRTRTVPKELYEGKKIFKTNNTPEMIQKQKQEELKEEMIKLNNNQKFNPNSPKQVAKILFGVSTEDVVDGVKVSTDKDTLEAMAGSNKMADLILQYRKCTSQIRYIQKSYNRKQPYYTISANEQHQTSEGEDVDPLLLVDASACIFRAYHSMPPLHRSDGTPVGAVLGFCNIINRLILHTWIQGNCPRIVLCFDSSTKKSTFRHELFPDYKGQRPPCPIDLVPQFELVKEAANAYGIPSIEAPIGYEADDVIATLATIAHEDLCMNVHVLSADKDLMQLVTQIPPPASSDALTNNTSSTITMIDPFNQKRYSYSEVKNKFHGIRPDQLRDVLALAGDASDNVPGVPGIGVKIASNLMQEFGTLDNLLELVHTENNQTVVPQKKRRENLIDYTDQAKLSRELVQLDTNIPLDKLNLKSKQSIKEELRIKPLQKERLLQFYASMGFQDLKSRTMQRLDYGTKQFNKLNEKKKEKKLVWKNRDHSLLEEEDEEDIVDVPF